jgi:hypothetical protein
MRSLPTGRARGERRRSIARPLAAGLLLLASVTVAGPSAAAGAVGDPTSTRAVGPAAPACEFWVAPSGDDADPGTQDRPWATLGHAAEAVPDRGCTVWFGNGVYRGNTELERRFDERVTFRAVNPYRAVFEGDGYVLDLSGSSRVSFRGFEFRHSGSGADGIVVYVGGSDTDHISFRNDIFHDSYDNDVMKILDGASKVSVRDSVFYNQGDNEQHIDVNSVTGVTVEGNIFFNDFEASGRADPGSTKAYIVVKDSNDDSDGVVGSERITIARNVFLNWQGDIEPFLQIGNDGKPYFEARNVDVQNNLFIGNSESELHAVVGVSGARQIDFVNNTVVGDLPAGSFAFHVDIKDANPRNDTLRFVNNIWCDPTGTMDDFSGGDPSNTVDLTLDNNLYWNGGSRIPRGELVSPLVDDGHRIVRNPRLAEDQRTITLPVWEGSAFASGASTIRAEFRRLVSTYGAIPASSPAVDRAVRAFAPEVDILGHRRDRHPDLGASEA